MSEYRITHDYPYPQALLWRALTEPALVPQWTSSGRGGTPVGFAPIAGTKFQYVAKPLPGWNGIVQCEVLEVNEPSVLRYSWRGDGEDEVSIVSCTLEPTERGTHLTWDHTGFTGVGGFFMSRILSSVRKKMLTEGLPALLAKEAGR